jgi:hypothetical protein
VTRALLALLLVAGGVPSWAVPPPPPPVASPAQWAQLVSRARSAPTYMEETIGHRVYAVIREQPVAGQVCPDGRRPVNRLFLAEPLAGATFRVHYLRIASLCVGAADEPDLQLFMLNAGDDGVIDDWSLMDARSGHIVSGISGSPTPEQLRRLEEYRASLVALFLSL